MRKKRFKPNPKSTARTKPVKTILRKNPTATDKRIEWYKSKEFLQSDEWFALRYKVLARYGATCQCCGESRKDGAVIQVDHIKPRSIYPELAIDEWNLQILCKK
jgi:5-methylcytosine-specific restriction endonuclease McrA